MLSESPLNLNNNLDYTLRAFPNHHRALYTMVRLRLRQQGEKYAGYPVECYLERALRFKSDDGAVLTIYGIYLYKIAQYEQATQKLKEAVMVSPESAEAHYNLGLVLYRTNRLDEAVKHAKIANELGYPLDGLIRRLKQSDAWPP